MLKALRATTDHRRRTSDDDCQEVVEGLVSRIKRPDDGRPECSDDDDDDDDEGEKAGALRPQSLKF